MEKFDVAIVGAGSAGLAALNQLSNLGKQAVLLESGKTIGSKNISGGILYSKKPKHGKIYNVEDVYGQEFVTEAPLERLITKYILHATSNEKVFSIDLSSAHSYQTNFAYSVLMNKLNSWFAKQAGESAEKFGGGIIPGVHVQSIEWKDGITTVETNELDRFQVRAIIAADGVNSEIAELTGARPKFVPHELYQGTKVVIKLPEQLMEQRFDITGDEGAAHLFSGDIAQRHIGGGFLYTNRDTISLGGVYHYDSLLEKAIEPYELINRLILNPMVREFIKDEVAQKEEIDKTLPKEEQLRIRFAVSKLIKTWQDLRQSYYSTSGSEDLITSGKYKTREEIVDRLDLIRKELNSKYNTKFITDYVELEYGAKLVPDGKRCRMKKPTYKNVLFVGDAAGRGIFVGPRIEGINVGIDDAVRAANAVSRSLDRNNFEHEYLGGFYAHSVDESPYTKDMKQIDKDYLKIFLAATKEIPKDIIGSRYSMIFKLMSSETFRGLAVGFANILGYDRLLPILESEETYSQVPIELAEKLGKRFTSDYQPSIPSIAERIAKLKYDDDTVSHILVNKPNSEFMKKMVLLCPTKCYSIEDNQVVLQHEGCIECGTCAPETQWRHPRGEKGISYQYG
jgi:electron transfer flavoprotein-quinone oxidoreductase